MSAMPLSHRFSVAPMLDWTDRHCRYFHRLLTRQALLYTEMVTTGALLHGDAKHLLQFNTEEHPVALQLGGSVSAELAQAARLAEQAGYDEINLNVGCPSDRVQNGAFGACLMANPALVADCIRAMQDAVSVPITVKHRTGIDDLDSYALLAAFVETVSATGCKTFIIHARKAWLEGLSPKENREIPPLQYDEVYRVKQDYPHLEIIVNGGVQSLDEAEQHLVHVDGVMIGRAAYHTPWLLADVDQRLFGQANPVTSQRQAVEKMIPYIKQHLSAGGKLSHVTRHMLGLFHGSPGARGWRRVLSEQGNKPGADPEVVKAALAQVQE